jgi:zinc protease
LERALNPWPKDDVRYIPTVDESLDRLRAVSYDQVTSLYRDYLGSQNGELTIVGDFDSGACLAALKLALDGWTATKPYARIAMPEAGEQTGAKQIIDTPDKANATYVAGLVFPMRDDDADYPALIMGNFILGSGTLSSRLGDRIRQKEGLTYGVSSALSVSAQDQRASLTVTAICNPTNMARLEICVKEELNRLLRDGVSPDELEKAKQGYLEAQKVGRENDMALGGALTALRHLDRTMAFDAELEKKIQAVTPDDVAGALHRHIDPAKLVIVTAGDFGSASKAGGSR